MFKVILAVVALAGTAQACEPCGLAVPQGVAVQAQVYQQTFVPLAVPVYQPQAVFVQQAHVCAQNVRVQARQRGRSRTVNVQRFR